MGLAGAWIVMTIDLIFRSSLCFYVFKRGKWKYLKVQKGQLMNKLIFNYLAYNNQNQNELYFKMDKIISEK